MLYTASILLKKFVRDILIVVVVTALAVSFVVYYTNIHPEKLTDERNPSTLKMDYENVNFTSATDALALKGWFVPVAAAGSSEPRPTIIVTHGLGLSKAHALDWSYYLHDEYNLFLFDFRGHGASEGTVTTFGSRETRDVLGAIEYVKSRDDADPTRIGIVGYSMGATTAIMTAQVTADIQAIVADSPYASLQQELERLYEKYGIIKKPMAWLTGLWSRALLQVNPVDVAPAESVKFTTAPMLLMAPEDNDQRSADSAREIYYNALVDDIELWTVEGDHLALFASHREEYMRRVTDFLDTHLE
ncbi:MAG: alpha/beta hydrolase [bacterium]|nr:alpha/beta hydrolase [bacterium]